MNTFYLNSLFPCHSVSSFIVWHKVTFTYTLNLAQASKPDMPQNPLLHALPCTLQSGVRVW